MCVCVFLLVHFLIVPFLMTYLPLYQDGLFSLPPKPFLQVRCSLIHLLWGTTHTVKACTKLCVCVCACVCVCYVRNKFCVFFPAGAFTDCPFLLTQFPLHREGLPSILDLPKPLIQDRWSRLLCRLLWCPTHTKVCVGVGVHVHGNGWCCLYIFVCMSYSMRIDSSNICGIVQTYSMRMDSSNICGIVQTYTMRMDSSNICAIVQTHIFPQLLVVFTLLY